MTNEGSAHFHFGEDKHQGIHDNHVNGTTPFFKIAVLGDFSGRASRGICQVGSSIVDRLLLETNVNNIDEIIKVLGIRIDLPLGGCRHSVSHEITELDDFHPDNIYTKVAIFQEFDHLRKNLNDPKTFEFAAAEVNSWKCVDLYRRELSSEYKSLGDTSDGAEASNGCTLDHLLDRPYKKPERLSLSESTINLSSLLQEIVAPYIVAEPDLRQQHLISLVDKAIAVQMRSILQYGEFKTLEALWRALHFLVTRVEVNERVKVILMDISKDELQYDLSSVDRIQRSGTYKLVVDKATGVPKACPWSVLLGAYEFSDSSEDVELLKRMSMLGKICGAPFIASAASQLISGDPKSNRPTLDEPLAKQGSDVQDSWVGLRSIPESSNLGLIFPHFLVRLPYAKTTDPIDAFEFEEFEGIPEHDDYLWGNPSFLVACLLANEFCNEGRHFNLDKDFEVSDLLAHFHKVDDKSEMKPYGEMWITDQVAIMLKKQGIMALRSVPKRNAIVLNRIHSIAIGGKTLSGRWQE